MPAWTLPLLLAAGIVLLPFGRSVELPLAVFAIYGLYASATRFRSLLADKPVQVFGLVFLLLWAPMLTALPDAAMPGRAASNAAVFLRFLFAGIGLIALIRQVRQFDLALHIIGWVTTAWVVDALIQAVAGRNLLGNPDIGGQLTGIFYPRQSIGHVLAILLPLYVFWLSRMARAHRVAWILLPLYCAVILLSGKRAAWIMMGFGLAMLGLVAFLRLPRAQRLRGSLAAALLAATALSAAMLYPPFQQKATHTLGVFSTDFARFDEATSYRATIWRVALQMAQEHWINGVGTRGFRYVYPQYAQSGDYFLALNPETGPTHPHQLTLEIAAETGAIGLMGFAAFWIWLIARARRMLRENQQHALAWLAAAAAAMLPLNTGHAFYGNFMSALVFFLLAAHFACYRASGMPRENPLV